MNLKNKVALIGLGSSSSCRILSAVDKISIFFGALEVQEFNKLLCRAVGFHFKIDFEKQFDLIASVNFYVLTKDCYIEFN